MNQWLNGRQWLEYRDRFVPTLASKLALTAAPTSSVAGAGASGSSGSGTGFAYSSSVAPRFPPPMRTRPGASTAAATTSHARAALRRVELEKNDYAQHFVDTGLRPQNFIRDTDLTERFAECVSCSSSHACPMPAAPP